MFRFTGPSPGQISKHSTGTVHSASTHTIVCAFAECTVLCFDIWRDEGLVNRNMSPEFLILVTNIHCVID